MEKLLEAIHYVCDKASRERGENGLDRVKLNKVLWYADVRAYMVRREPITEARFVKKPLGPVVQQFRTAIEELERRAVLLHGLSPSDGHWTPRFDVIGQHFESKYLTKDEIQILDDVYPVVVHGRTSLDVSDETHGEIWKLARDDEPLPLFTAFAEQLGEVTDQHVALMQKRA